MVRVGAIDMEFLFRRLEFAGHGIFRLDRFTGHWKGPDQPLVIGLALQVGGCERFWSVYAVQGSTCNNRPARMLATRDGGLLRAPSCRPARRSPVAVAFTRALSLLTENPRASSVVLFPFLSAVIPIEVATGSWLRHQSSRRVKSTDTA
jgi:hypothetical protein